MKLVTSLQSNEVRAYIKTLPIAMIALTASACATSSGSSCEKLAKNQKGEIRKMVKRFKKSASGRHVILLETGSGISDLCRTHFIDAEEFIKLPASASLYCTEQERTSDNYCTVYSVDGEYTGDPVKET